MDFNDIPGALLAVQIVLHYLTCGVVVTGDAFSELSNEGVKRQGFGVAVYGRYKIWRCDNIDFAIEHIQGVDWMLAFGAMSS